jgi:hypothetical protein
MVMFLPSPLPVQTVLSPRTYRRYHNTAPPWADHRREGLGPVAGPWM